MAVQRNRSEGWQHAKLSGHKNEENLTKIVKQDNEIQKRLLNAAHVQNATIIDIGYGGLCESDVDCCLGGKTKSKTDMWLNLSNGKRLNISIKKDEGGQVFLIGIDRFINGFELQYNKTIPSDVKRAIELFCGSADDTQSIINEYHSANFNLEKRKHRLVAETLRKYDPSLHTALLEWVKNNICELCDFCFARGLASNQQDWSHLV